MSEGHRKPENCGAKQQREIMQFNIDKSAVTCYPNTSFNKRNALMRNSTQRTEHRELLAGEKQRKRFVELASEHLPEIFL